MGQGETKEDSMDNQRADDSAEYEREVRTIFVGGMTLEEYLRGETVYDDVPSFVSPGT
jgi:hypothetical protein